MGNTFSRSSYQGETSSDGKRHGIGISVCGQTGAGADDFTPSRKFIFSSLMLLSVSPQFMMASGCQMNLQGVAD